MKTINWKAFIPHLWAIAVFLITSAVFCKSGLNPNLVLKQSDISGWQGMSHQLMEYKEIHGHFPLWITNMFGGMPAFQVAMEGFWSPLSFIDHFFQLWLPQPMNFFFLACISFYFMCVCLGVRSIASILGAIGFAYCSFSPIIIAAGHNTQMLALAYAPAVIGAVYLIFQKKYLTGFALTGLFTSLQIGQSHQQISYYLFLVLLAMTTSFLVMWIQKKEFAHLLKSTSLLITAGVLSVAVNALTLGTTYDYAKESKRGGQLVMDTKNKDENVQENKTKGLSKEYAFQWSYGKMESMSLLFPGVMGYGFHYAERDEETSVFPKLEEGSHAVSYLTDKFGGSVNPDQISTYLSQQVYWGDQPFTSGPVYIGAIVCFLALIGLFALDNKHKWWIIAITIFAIILAWGKNLPGFNYFIFDHFPLYNKFRVPTMTLVIPQLLLPLLAALTVEKILQTDPPLIWGSVKKGCIATAIVFAGALFTYANTDFSNENKERTRLYNELTNSTGGLTESGMQQINAKAEPKKDNSLYENMIANFKGADASQNAKEVVAALRKDRAGFFMGDIIRSFLFVLMAAILIILYTRKNIPITILPIGLAVLIGIDLLTFGMKYLNDKNYDSKEKYEANEFPLTPADDEIKKDKDPNFRVFNMAGGDPFQDSKTSYYHKSIGGYHPAKLGIYDDLVSYQMSGIPNTSVLNMLNTKYVLQRQGDNVVAAVNSGALGNAWFVKGYKLVDNAVEEMKAISNFNPKDTAIINKSYSNQLTLVTPADSTATIMQTTFDNDAITYKSTSNATHLAIFSEIYYKDWKVKIDGKPADVIKANYVLRALVIPAGNHNITFSFEPASFYTGRIISASATWILVIILGALLFTLFKRKKD